MQKKNIEYSVNEILVAAGGRPLIYAVFRAIGDAGDKIIYGVPSWNNNHYTHFIGAEHVVIETTEAFELHAPAKDIKPHTKGATLLSFVHLKIQQEQLLAVRIYEEICDLVLEENKSRKEGERKLFVMYDQMYWHLTFGSIEHYNPVSLRPGMKEYTIFIDAISKVFAATGVRVGWSLGPEKVISKMKAILTHVGAVGSNGRTKSSSLLSYKTQGCNDRFLYRFKEKMLVRLIKYLKAYRS